MPIYAYRCESCGHEQDVLQKISDAAPDCPACGNVRMSKQVTAAAFDFKGAGWYKTDFASSGCPAAQHTASGKEALPPCAGACDCNAAAE